jgi:hypothetical protein
MASSVRMAQLGGIGAGVALGWLVGMVVGDGLGVPVSVGSGALTSGVWLGCAVGTGHAEPPNGVDVDVPADPPAEIGDEMAADGEHALNAIMSSRTRKRLGWRMRPHGDEVDRVEERGPRV